MLPDDNDWGLFVYVAECYLRVCEFLCVCVCVCMCVIVVVVCCVLLMCEHVIFRDCESRLLLLLLL